MTIYFLDTSAIVKRYFVEKGHSWIIALCNSAQGNKLYISQAALVEVVATMCRKTREQIINPASRDELISRFRRDVQTDYNLSRVTTAIYTSAGNLCRSYTLLAYDAVQLACALNLQDKALIASAPAPTFVCADINLCNIAATEELNVENPNDYP